MVTSVISSRTTSWFVLPAGIETESFRHRRDEQVDLHLRSGRRDEHGRSRALSCGRIRSARQDLVALSQPIREAIHRVRRYRGVVQLWDVQKEMSTWENNTHRRRVWSIDYSRVDPTKLASASDDGTVQVYSTLSEGGDVRRQDRANVCSVKFHPESAHLLSIGSADHNVHCYDLRQTSKPLMTLRGHRKAVSYVCWVGDELVSASTDNSLKLWNVKSQNSQDACVRTFSGHTNEKNFVGLSANSDGYIACGSEDNVLHVYSRNRHPCRWHGTVSPTRRHSRSRADARKEVSSLPSTGRRTPSTFSPQVRAGN